MYTNLIAVVDEQLTETVSMIPPGPWTKEKPAIDLLQISETFPFKHGSTPESY